MENNPENIEELQESLYCSMRSSITSNNEAGVNDKKKEETECNSENSDSVVLEESETESQTTNRSFLDKNDLYEYSARSIANNREEIEGLQSYTSYLCLYTENNEGNEKQTCLEDSSEFSEFVLIENDTENETKAQITKRTASFTNSSELLVFEDDHFGEDDEIKCSSNKGRRQTSSLSDISKSSDEVVRIWKKQSYTKHPHFHHLSSTDAEKYLKSKRQGDYIIQPSSKDDNHLTITWIVTDNIYQSINVRKHNKSENLLLPIGFWMNEMPYEDINDIIARSITPMAAFALDLLNSKYYKVIEGALDREAEEFLKEEKEKHGIDTCIISASRDYPGKFFLSYFAKNEYIQETITVTKYGFLLRGFIMLLSLKDLYEWLDACFEHSSNSEPLMLEAVINEPFNGLEEELRLIRAYLRHALYPKFENMSFIEAAKYMTDMNQGDFIIRPSSKGLTHIAITWKVTKKICQHMDIRKGNEYDDLSLMIGEDVYYGLDDVIKKYIKPMAKYAQELLHYENYRDIECNLQTTAEEILKEEQKDSEFLYIISATKDNPGDFLISCMHNKSFHHDYITVTPNGICYNNKTCGTVQVLDALIRK